MICYWLRDFRHFVGFEKQFKPDRLKSYERGDIIKVNFGFNIGSEHGGWHYAIVVDNKNFLHSPVLTVIPMTSIKSNKEINRNDLDLGDEIYCKLKIKHDKLMNANVSNNDSEEEINNSEKLKIQYRKAEKEILNMKKGSIALVGQITTISKMRIIDPKNSQDALDGIKLSPEKLDCVNGKIRELFLHGN